MQTRLILFFLLCFSMAEAQKNYFQQQTDYTIDVSLDDQNHILRGFESIQYKNNSKDTLRYLFFHLWPNAYKNDKSAFTEQLVEQGKKEFYFSKAFDKGFIDSLHFMVNDEPVNISNFNNYEDVVLLELQEPLLPEKTINITTPFRVVLPSVFSRLGHVEQDYQICQWYPKPAVYDAQGWHPMPYLDQGEFYSEFGSFDVRITLPEAYWVAATGILQTSSEKEAIDQHANNPNHETSAGNQSKTIVYKQDRIHDFAWFASKDYLIKKEDIQVDQRTIPCYSFFKPLHKELYKNSIDIAAKTIQFLSAHVGTYPYGQVSMVEGVTSDIAGGMEYPMLAHLGKVRTEEDMRAVIVHEVGHNWFYGILGSNERDYAWMDEGINSFYEKWICEHLTKETKNEPNGGFGNKWSANFNNRLFYELSNQQHVDQPIEIPSTHFTSFNYGAMVYTKSLFMFNYLQAYLSEALFDRCMQRYFDAWKFKHPQPEDIRMIFEQESGRDLAWFFNDLIKTNKHLDFKITKVIQGNVFATAKHGFKGPIPISAFAGDSLIQTQWISYPYQDPAAFTTQQASIYRTTCSNDWQDANPKNSFYQTHHLLKRYRFKPNLGFSVGVKEHHHLSLLPAIGYNYYDGLMAGGILHNIQLPNQAFQYALVPMYSIGTRSLTGTGFASYTFFPKERFQAITLGVQAKCYHDNESDVNLKESLYTRYIKANPYLLFEVKPAYARSSVRNSFYVSSYFIQQEEFTYKQDPIDSLFRPQRSTNGWKVYGYARFLHDNKRTFNPFSYDIDATGNADFLKLRLQAKLKIDYHYLNKAFYVRFFAGKFFSMLPSEKGYQLQSQWLTATTGASNDYLYDQTYLARSEQDHWMSKQIGMNEGGMKVRSTFLANPIGVNDNWLTSLNLRSDLPIKSGLKLQLFLDLATYNQAAALNSSGNKLIYDAGVEWHLLNDLLVFYVPLLNCKDYKDYLKSTYPKNRFLQSITFSLNLNKLNWVHSQQALNRFMN